MPLLGDKFPDLSVVTSHGPMNLPGDVSGSWFVLFSHPADFTPVCTTEFVAFQKRYNAFKELGVKLVGMSVDQVFSHIKWVEWIKEKLDVEIEYPIIAANDTIANKLGLLHPGKGTNTVRAVFVVDPQGIVRLMIYYPQEIGRNMDEVVRAVRRRGGGPGLQVYLNNWLPELLSPVTRIVPSPAARFLSPLRLPTCSAPLELVSLKERSFN